MNIKNETLQKIIFFEFLTLVASIFSIPLFETPKNLFISLSFIIFFIRHYFEGNLKTALFTKDTRIGFLIISISALISSFFAEFPVIGMRGFIDFIKMYLIFIILRDFLDNKSVKIIIFSILISTLIGVIWGGIELITGKSSLLELHSVGHVNHSSIYLALSLVLALSFLWTKQKLDIQRIFMLVATVTIFSALIIAGSRATIGALMIAITFMLFFYSERKWIVITLISFIFIAGLSLTLISNPFLLSKNFSFSDTSLIDRINIWSEAWKMFLSNPLFGVGAKHFKFYCSLASGSHAHNLYLNILAQFGAVGFASLIYLIYKIITELKKSTKNNPAWYSVIAGLIIVLVNGILNTTLHSEHGLLFAIICSLGLNRNGK